jgi:hypothetical protein
VKVHLAYYSEKTTISVVNEIFEVKQFQIIVWVSIAIRRKSPLNPVSPKLPAKLDIGNTHNFALTRTQLLNWAGIHSERIPRMGRIRREGTTVPLHKADLWLHTDAESYKLEIDEGIAIFDGDWPRLPILGLRALTNSKLQTFIYGDTLQALIRTPPKWYWPF